MQNEYEFSILSWNCWLLPCISKHKITRLQEITKYLKSNGHSIVCLQEVWSHSDYDYIANELYSKLPYSDYLEAGTIGSGLCIFSKFPIVNRHFTKYEINGHYHNICLGDRFSGKGFSVHKIRLEYNLSILIFNTHTHVENDKYTAHRLYQSIQLIDSIRLLADSVDFCVVLGDFNAKSNSLLIQLLKKAALVKDSFKTAKFKFFHPTLYGNNNRSVTKSKTRKVSLACSNFCPSKTLPMYNIANTTKPTSSNKRQEIEYGTSEVPSNSYTSMNSKSLYGNRIDYIFYRSKHTKAFRTFSYEHPVPNCINYSQISYSDHEAVSVLFNFIFDKQSNKEAILNDSGVADHIPNSGFQMSMTSIYSTNQLKKNVCSDHINKNKFNYDKLSDFIATKHKDLLESVDNVLLLQVKKLRVQFKLCVIFGFLSFCILLSTLYLPDFKWYVKLIISIMQYFLLIFALYIFIIQTIIIKNECNALICARRSLVFYV